MNKATRVILASLGAAGLPEEWRAARSLIARERRDVEALATKQSIYGFNTLLGHLDNRSLGDMQEALLRSHLVGQKRPLLGASLNVASAVKTEQIHPGGSGVHPDTYDLLTSVRFDPTAIYHGAWQASYGSGDVVPAAWWLSTLLNQAGVSPDELHPGDVIALINGNFMSTARAIEVLLSSILYTARLTSTLQKTCCINFSQPLNGWIAELARAFKPASGVVPQRAVSVRDCLPTLLAADSEIRHLGNAIERRLSSVSGNPVFVGQGPDTQAISQSSFLGPELAAAISSHHSYVRFSSAAAVSAFHCSMVESDADSSDTEMSSIQPRKVATAALLEIDGLSMQPTFYMQESQGVEDLADGALASCTRLLKVLRLAGYVLDSCQAPSEPDMRAIGVILRHAGLSTVPVESVLRSFENAAEWS